MADVLEGVEAGRPEYKNLARVWMTKGPEAARILEREMAGLGPEEVREEEIIAMQAPTTAEREQSEKEWQEYTKKMDRYRAEGLQGRLVDPPPIAPGMAEPEIKPDEPVVALAAPAAPELPVVTAAPTAPVEATEPADPVRAAALEELDVILPEPQKTSLQQRKQTLRESPKQQRYTQVTNRHTLTCLLIGI